MAFEISGQTITPSLCHLSLRKVGTILQHELEDMKFTTLAQLLI